MQITELNDNKIQIEAMGIADFLGAVVNQIKDGYELNLNDNDMYPVAYGGFFSVILKKNIEVIQENSEDKSEETKRGRKPKSV